MNIDLTRPVDAVRRFYKEHQPTCEPGKPGYLDINSFLLPKMAEYMTKWVPECREDKPFKIFETFRPEVHFSIANSSLNRLTEVQTGGQRGAIITMDVPVNPDNSVNKCYKRYLLVRELSILLLDIDCYYRTREHRQLVDYLIHEHSYTSNQAIQQVEDDAYNAAIELLMPWMWRDELAFLRSPSMGNDPLTIARAFGLPRRYVDKRISPVYDQACGEANTRVDKDQFITYPLRLYGN